MKNCTAFNTSYASIANTGWKPVPPRQFIAFFRSIQYHSPTPNPATFLTREPT